MKGKEEGLSVGGGVRRDWDEPAPGMDVDSARPQLHTLKIAKSPLGVGGSASSPTSASASASAPPTIVTSTSTSTSTGATITTTTTATTTTSQSQSQSQVQTSASALGLPTPTSTVSTSAVGAGGSGGAGGLGGGNAGGGAGGGAHRWSTSSSITAVTASSPTSPMYANPPSSSSSTQRGWKTHAKAASALNMNLTPRELLLQSAQMHRPRAGTVYLGGDGRAHHDYPYPIDAEAEAVNMSYVQAHAEVPTLVAPPRKPLRIPVPALPHAVAAPDAYAHGEGVPARWIPFSAASSSSSSNPSSSAYLAELVKRYTATAPAPLTGEHVRKLSGDWDECEAEPGAHTGGSGPDAHTPTPAWIREARLGKFTRQFRWGALDILNAAHCDFVPLRRAVFECMTVRSLLFF